MDNGSINTWATIFNEDRKELLRKYTYKLTQRLETFGSQLFEHDIAGGWESWFLGVCREYRECAGGLGIPAYYDEHLLAQLVAGGSQGLPQSHSEAVQLRIRMALSLFKRVLYHPLCSPSLSRFQHSLAQVLQNMNGPGLLADVQEYELHGKIFPKKNGVKVDWFNILISKPHAEKRDMFKAFRDELKKFFPGSLDAELYTLLLAIAQSRVESVEEAKGDGSPEKEAARRWKDFRLLLATLLADDVLPIDTEVVAWWALAELVYENQDIDAGAEKEKYKNAIERCFVSLYKTPGCNHRHSGYMGQIPEYAEKEFLFLLFIGYSAISILAWLDCASDDEQKDMLDQIKSVKSIYRDKSGKFKEVEKDDTLEINNPSDTIVDLRRHCIELITMAYEQKDTLDQIKPVKSIYRDKSGKFREVEKDDTLEINNPSDTIVDLRRHCIELITMAYDTYTMDMEDEGSMAIMCTKLYALLEMWRWNMVYETAACLVGDKIERRGEWGLRDLGLDSPYNKEDKEKEIEKYVKLGFGKELNSYHSKIKFTWPIWSKLLPLPFPGNAVFNEYSKHFKKPRAGGKLEKMPGSSFSVMIFAPPGLGKGEIVNTLWKRLDDDCGKDYVKRREVIDRRIIECIPPEMGRNWLEERRKHLTNKNERPYYVVFVDEIHLPSTPSAFGLLLKPLQESSSLLELAEEDYQPDDKKKSVPRAMYIFATSAFRSKEDFLRAAAKTHDVAMRDFATRIKHWVKLPDLFTIPEQKMGVACAKMREADPKTARYFAVRAVLDLSIRSSRDVKMRKEKLKSDPDAASEADVDVAFGESWSYYPEWVGKAIKDKMNGSTYTFGRSNKEQSKKKKTKSKKKK